MKKIANKIVDFFTRNEYTLVIGMLCLCCFLLGACSAHKKPEVIETKVVQKVATPYIVNVKEDFFGIYDFSTMTRSDIEEVIYQLETFIHVTRQMRTTSDDAVIQAEHILDDAIETLETENYVSPYSEDDLNLLAWIIFIEAGDNSCDDEEQQLVGQVILNRQKNGGISGKLENPSIADVINEQGQYYIAVKRGYNISADNINMSNVTEKCFKNARYVLEGKLECPDNVLYQATMKQGSGVYKSFYHPYYNNTTYFCFG